MALIRKWLVLLVLVLVQTPAWANLQITHVREELGDLGVVKVFINLSGPVTQLKTAPKVSEQGVVIVAEAQQAALTWQSMELNFEESNRRVRRVELSGGGQNKRLLLTLAFASEYEPQLVPQLKHEEIVLYLVPESLRDDFDSSGAANTYAVEIQTPSGLTAQSLPREIVDAHHIYGVPTDPRRTRLGFFSTETAATATLNALRGAYPKATITQVTEMDRDVASATALFPLPEVVEPEPVHQDVSTHIEVLTPGTIDQVDAPRKRKEIEIGAEIDRSLLDEAQLAFTAQEWPRAAALYTKASKNPGLREEALERLGVTRQKNRQIAHAKAVYEQYLAEFPEGAGSNRVQQRLRALMDSSMTSKLERPRARKSSDSWRMNAHLSQFYRRYSLDIEGADKRVPLDAVFTDGNLIARRHSDSGFHEARLAVGHIQDFSDDTDQKSLRLRRAYWESYFENYRTGFTIGRQSRRKSGVLGRFDGIALGYKQNDAIQWNAIGGRLVRSAYRTDAPDQPFYGASIDWQLAEGLNVSAFFIEQKYDNILDRRAVGTHVYYRQNRSLITGIVDYDLHHQALNNLHLTGSYDVNANWRLNAAVDIRRSPYLTTANALIGQQYDDLSELEQDLVDIKLGDLAEDRTAISKTYRLGFDGKLNQTWHLNLDASTAHYSSTDASAGIAAYPDRTDHYFSFQLRADDWLVKNGYSAIQVRHQISDVANTTTVLLNNRFRLFDDWLIHPRILASQRDYKTSSQEQLQIRPSLRIDYTGFKRFRLEAEAGYDWNTRDTLNDELTMEGIFLRIGYRVLF